MSRTAVFLQLGDNCQMTLKSCDNDLRFEPGMQGSTLNPGAAVLIASVGDPGGLDHANSGFLELVGNNQRTVRLRVVKVKKENADIDLYSEIFGTLPMDRHMYKASATNDYPEHGDPFSRSVTIHINRA